MSLNPNEYNEVVSSIASIINDHITSPFMLLREASLVAELYSVLTRNPHLAKQSNAKLNERKPRSAAGPRYTWQPNPVATQRVQLEMRVAQSPSVSSSAVPHDPSDSIDKVVDLVMLSPEAHLFVEVNGPGDVVRILDTGSVDAAFEVKSSPSLASGQIPLYCADIQALKQLSSHGVDAFFVVLDKSLDVYGSMTMRTSANIWNPRYKLPVHTGASRPSKPHVHVSVIGQLPSGHYQCDQFYVV